MSNPGALSATFLAALPATLRARCGPEAALEGRLGRLVSQARAVWPEIPYDPQTFVRLIQSQLDLSLRTHLRLADDGS